MYYLGPRARLLHHITFLSSDRIADAQVYVVARRFEEAGLARYGEVTRLTESPRTRGESSPVDRYTLFRLRFFPDLMRYPEPSVNGMQATGRAPGPTLPEPTKR